MASLRSLLLLFEFGQVCDPSSDAHPPTRAAKEAMATVPAKRQPLRINWGMRETPSDVSTTFRQTLQTFWVPASAEQSLNHVAENAESFRRFNRNGVHRACRARLRGCKMQLLRATEREPGRQP